MNRRDKSDRDAAGWSPLRNRGWFAAKIVQVKHKYGLSVDRDERDSLRAMLLEDSSREVLCP